MFLLSSKLLIAQLSFQGYGKVTKRLGYEVYILSEPVQPYFEVFTIENTDVEMPRNPNHRKLPKLPNFKPIADKISEYAQKVKKEDKDNVVDGIIYSGGHAVVAIKFDEEYDMKYSGLAKVRNQLGVDIYVLSTPDALIKWKKKWIIEESRRGLSKFLDKLSRAFSEGSSIEFDFNTFFNRIAQSRKNKKKWPDAILYDASGKIIGVDYVNGTRPEKLIPNKKKY